MAKQTQQLVLMLAIGIFVGTALVMVSKTPVATDVNEDSTYSGATATEITEVSGDGRSLPELSTGTQMLAPEIPANERPGLVVRDQPRGEAVFVNGLNSTETKWVAIYDDREGRPGWILGAARIQKGDKEARVPLLRAEGTVTGATYYAAILNDDGDDEFNRLTDLPPLAPDRVIIVSFKAN